MDLGKIIAFNLNKLRTERSLTLGQLAKLPASAKRFYRILKKGAATLPLTLSGKLPTAERAVHTPDGS